MRANRSIGIEAPGRPSVSHRIFAPPPAGERRSGLPRQTPENRLLTSGVLDFHAGLPLEGSDLLNKSHTPLEEFKNLEIQFVDLAAKRIQPQGSSCRSFMITTPCAREP